MNGDCKGDSARAFDARDEEDDDDKDDEDDEEDDVVVNAVFGPCRSIAAMEVEDEDEEEGEGSKVDAVLGAQSSRKLRSDNDSRRRSGVRISSRK